MKVRSGEPTCSMRTDRLTDRKTKRQTDITKLIVAFRNSVNGPKRPLGIPRRWRKNDIKMDLTTCYRNVWSGFISLRKAASGRLLCTLQRTFFSHRIRYKSWPKNFSRRNLRGIIYQIFYYCAQSMTRGLCVTFERAKDNSRYFCLACIIANIWNEASEVCV
jgi:hypothetical protein